MILVLVNIQGYSQRMRLQRRLFGIFDLAFLTLMVLFSFKLVALSNYLPKVQKL